MNTAADAPSELDLPSDLIAEDPEAFKQLLLATLVARRPTVLRAAGVSRIGTAALQLLLAFHRECQARGLGCELRDPSQALLDGLACAGLERELNLGSARA